MFHRRLTQAVRPLMRTARPLPPSPSKMRIESAMQSRLSSTSPPSPHGSFYKSFGRPITKVLLIAMLTYQLIYLGWVKLEVDETKAIRNAEIRELEDKVKELQGKTGS
ncbi:uncharacterized protein DNG_03469 [Cephalotrichum gorgonifer]|uniref:Uncharacterized protein n=1 Tax=Cephalotrichum gorgonifer TaxID=2041049 RepID=A0AAE8MVC4_9PEZI|nr:uncharacterized protein DNG_03469 [Cephalotrichum gorgonifer]